MGVNACSAGYVETTQRALWRRGHGAGTGMSMTQQLYTTQDVSRLLQVDAASVSKWIDRGLLFALRTPGGHRRVRATDLRSFLSAHHMPIPEELESGRIRLLVVDDEAAVLEGLRRALKPHEGQVELFSTQAGAEVMSLLTELKPDGLLIDLNLPDLDGLEICRQVSAQKQHEGVLVVTMSAHVSSQTVNESLKAGAVSCLAKPLDVRQVLRLFQVHEPLLAASGS